MTADTTKEMTEGGALPPGPSVREVDLSTTPWDVSAAEVEASGAGGLQVLVRLHTHPVGRLLLDHGPIPAAALADRIWREVPQVREHLRADGLEMPDRAGPVAAVGADAPCLSRRRAALGDPPFMTVAVATRDRTASLLRCLRSVAELDYTRFEVVVVDSAPSDDRTKDAVLALGGRLGRAELHYVREDRPGLALAHNRAIEEASGTWLSITDDDVVVDRHWLAAIAEAASTCRVACVTGLILPAELETRAQVLLEQYGGYARGFAPWIVDTSEHRPTDPLFPLTVGRLGSGANMAFDLQVLRDVGGFDAATGAGTPARGGDDLVGFLRVLRAGYSVAYQPAALVWHWHRREYAGLRRQARHYGIGLGAYLTSGVVHDPRLLGSMIRRVYPGIRHLLDPASAKNVGKGYDFPHELERAERLGVLQGPFAYLHSCWRYRRATGR
jgi:GT2 family glycosyltransferase